MTAPAAGVDGATAPGATGTTAPGATEAAAPGATEAAAPGATEAAAPDVVAAAALAEVPDHGMVEVAVGSKRALLCRLGDDVFAVAATCPHHGAPLAEGSLDGAHVRCPWHGARFDVRTGLRVTVPTCRDLRSYPTEVRDGTVWVTVADGS